MEDVEIWMVILVVRVESETVLVDRGRAMMTVASTVIMV